MAIRTLSAAYFVSEILITNVSGTTEIQQLNLKTLQLMIAKYEPVYLTKLLGKTLYDQYVAGIAAGTPDAKWVTLNNKIYYTDTALTALGTGISPVANFVYFKFMRQNATTTLANMEGAAKHENFTNYGPSERMVNAWNEMCRMSDELQLWLWDNLTDYPDFDTYENGPEQFTRINLLGC